MKKGFDQLIRKADGWVVRNLRHYGNSVLPASLITCQKDVETGEQLLSHILREPVHIRQTENGYICETEKAAQFGRLEFKRGQYEEHNHRFE